MCARLSGDETPELDVWQNGERQQPTKPVGLLIRGTIQSPPASRLVRAAPAQWRCPGLPAGAVFTAAGAGAPGGAAPAQIPV
ncbi:hypothetical protein Y1Q_0021156 [Alligator mississippiensis]|uniref:Uncharacterized protein n=1 Tax=Alligator mississippiensis TaxID=8496 RepID=A0A151N006_ALLMI|nr:hypothetical protein Y1Q_0021156 [Alligator mississippiensis]